jgi:peptidylprolyl isomerase
VKPILPFAVCAAAILAASPLAAQDKPGFKPKLDPPQASDYRTVDPDNLLVIQTTKGRILVEMVPEAAPQSVARIKELAHEHFYDGLTFHRVVAQFMAQGGDPKGDGTGGSTKPDVPAEFTFRRGGSTPYAQVEAEGGLEDGFVKSLPVRGQTGDLMVMTADGKVNGWALWCTGVAGMARAGDPNSANSQFFLMRGFNGGLERNYTAWGRVLAGQDVVNALKQGEPVIDPDKMTSVRVASDLPPAQQPKVQVVDLASPWAKTALKYAENVCSLDLPAKVAN